MYFTRNLHFISLMIKYDNIITFINDKEQGSWRDRIIFYRLNDSGFEQWRLLITLSCDWRILIIEEAFLKVLLKFIQVKEKSEEDMVDTWVFCPLNCSEMKNAMTNWETVKIFLKNCKLDIYWSKICRK